MVYISHFCTRKILPNVLFTRISFPRNPSDSTHAHVRHRNAYLVTGSAAFIAGISLLAVPISTDAFWPFTIVRADTNGGEPPLVHNSSLPLLAAATNPDPNPQKGDSGVSMTEGSALMANAGPDGTLVDIEHGASGGEISTYTVATGDTFSSIAAKNGISVNTILWANNLTAKSALKPGQTLVILPVTGIEHKVLKGETVASLSKKYGGSIEDIISYNGLDEGQALTAGETIIIPDGEPAAAPVKTVAKTAKKLVTLPSVSGFSNPAPAGRCSQSVHGNNGIDIAAPSGTPIYAAAAGSVIIALDNGGYNGGFGNYVVINHPNGAQTLYAHMSRTATSVGASVAKGELIGYVGITGKATGYHLHFEVHKAANPFCR